MFAFLLLLEDLNSFNYIRFFNSNTPDTKDLIRFIERILDLSRNELSLRNILLKDLSTVLKLYSNSYNFIPVYSDLEVADNYYFCIHNSTFKTINIIL